MRPAVVVMIAFALGACGSSIGGGGPDGSPADGDMPDEPTIDGGPACASPTPTTCYASDCRTVLGNADCVNHAFRCPSGQYDYFQCFGGDCNLSSARYCRDGDGGITAAACSAGIYTCPAGTTEIGQPIDAAAGN
jgi:hypothetical protein